MLDPKESRFWQSTILSGLMDAEGLLACWNAIPPGKRDDPQHIERRLARQAVQARALSVWQARQLLAGRTSGFKVDRYVLLDLIGQGGMGRVYLAQDTRLNREVALKILSPERVNNPRAIARFQREARVGAQLQHENLVRIYDFGESSGRYYLVMEYIEGDTIGTMIAKAEKGRIPPSTAVKLVRQVAMGLQHAHRKGLIHRDVNPYNILVTRDGTAKLADLGLAIDLAEDDRVTREGATVGTFDYVAPEQARHSHSADIRSDIYSLGCSLYHMCSGQVPFPTPSLPEKLFAHQAMEPTPLVQVVPKLPAGLSDVVQRMMRKVPEERYATPLQVFQALECFEIEYSVVTDRHDAEHLTPETGVAAPVTVAAGADAALLEAGAAGGIAVAKSVGLRTPPDPAVDHDTGASARVPSTVLSSESGQGSDPEFPVDLIVAPEPSLSEGRSRTKIRSGSSNWGTSHEGNSLLRLPRYWLWGLLAIAITVLSSVMVLAVFDPFAETPTTHRKPPPIDEHVDVNKSPESTDKASSVQTQSPDLPSPIVVRAEGEPDQNFSADKLLDAMKTALGGRGRGWVELRNREPLKFTSTSTAPLDLLTASGPLSVRAAPGIEPIIEVELKGSKPLLATGSGVNLKMSGVTILVHYSQAAAPATIVPPAVIIAAGTSRIERCAFRVMSGPRPRGCRAFFSNMGALEVDRCWFEGFDRAIDVAADYRTHMRISQTMIVPASAQDLAQAQAGEWYGWGVKIQYTGAVRAQTKGSQANVLLDHCTIEGAGLFDMDACTGPAPVQVEVDQCVLQGNALLALNRKRPSADQISWQGQTNQYDIHGRTWIVNSASEGTPMFSASAMDLDGWLGFVHNDKNPIRAKLKFQIDPAARSESLQPRDFAIEASSQPRAHPGANPDLVGPWSRP